MPVWVSFAVQLFLQIAQTKLQWSAQSKIGSLENTGHKPRGGDKKIETIKLDFKERSRSKVGSKDHMGYVPGGGDVKVSKLHVKKSFFLHGKKEEGVDNV